MSTTEAKPATIDPHVYGNPVVVEVLVRVKALAFAKAEGFKAPPKR